VVTCGRRPGKNFLTFCSIGRVRSRVRPVDAAGMAAGPNALRGSGPKQKGALWYRCVDPSGFSRSPERPYLHYVVMPSPIGVANLAFGLSHAASDSGFLHHFHQRRIPSSRAFLQPIPLLKFMTSLQFGRVSTQPTLPYFVHLRCAEISYQSHSGRSSSFFAAEWWQRGPCGGPMQ